MVNLVLAYTNQGIDSVYANPADTSLTEMFGYVEARKTQMTKTREMIILYKMTVR